MVRAVLALVAAYLLGVVSVHAEEVPALGTRGLLAKLGVQLRLQPPFTRAGVEGAWEAGSDVLQVTRVRKKLGKSGKGLCTHESHNLTKSWCTLLETPGACMASLRCPRLASRESVHATLWLAECTDSPAECGRKICHGVVAATALGA